MPSTGSSTRCVPASPPPERRRHPTASRLRTHRRHARTSRGPPMPTTAAGDVWSARRAALDRARQRAVTRRRVAVIDELLDVLELSNLRRDRTIDRLLRARLRRLEAEVGLPLPRRVVRARNTA